MRSFKSQGDRLIDKRFIRAVIIGSVLGCIVITLLMLLTSLLLVNTGKFPEELLEYIVLAFLGISGLISGYVSGRLNKSKGLLCGAFSGVLIFLAVVVAGVIYNLQPLSLSIIYKFISVFVTGILGGILGVNKKEKLHIK